MKKLIGIIIIFSIYYNPSFSDGHKTKFKDIKGFKKQFISMSEKKINRIKEVKKSDGFPVYEGETAGCGYTRGKEHQDVCCKRNKKSRMIRHSDAKHGGVVPSFKMNICNVYRNDCMSRQITETN